MLESGLIDGELIWGSYFIFENTPVDCNSTFTFITDEGLLSCWRWQDNMACRSFLENDWCIALRTDDSIRLSIVSRLGPSSS